MGIPAQEDLQVQAQLPESRKIVSCLCFSVYPVSSV